MNRALRIELRRSNALPLAAAVIAVTVFVDVLLGQRKFWENNWMKMATGQRSDLLLMVVFAVGAGAMQAGLDQRRGVLELFASTPRPRRTRVLPVALALAIAAAGAYVITFAIGSLWVATYATYADPGAIAGVVGVGAVTMATAVWLGLLVGHLVRSRLTAPIASVLTLMVLALGSDILGSLGNGAALSLLMPDLSSSVEGAATVAERVSTLQGLWLLAVGVSALGGFLASSARFRILAVLPAALALVLVAPQLPHGRGYIAAYTIDPRAAELVCATGAPRVCVTRVDASRLPQVVPAARAALNALARLPHPPTAVIQYPQIEERTFEPPASSRADTVWLDLTPYAVDGRGRLSAEDAKTLTGSLLKNLGVTRGSCPHDEIDSDRSSTADEIGVAWLLGRSPVPDQELPAAAQERIRIGWTAFTSLPAAEQRRRVAAMHRALLTCQGDINTILTHGSTS